MADVFNNEISLSNVNVDLMFVDKTKGFPFEEFSGKNKQVSKLHKRSFADSKISGRVLWGDSFGNKFMATNTKGQPPEGQMPYLEEDPYSKKGLRVHWLCDSTDVERTDKVSEIMRSNGLATEKIKSKSKIKEISVNGELITIDELKKILLTKGFSSENMWYEDVKRYVKDTNFYIIEREMPIDERIADLSLANDEVQDFAARFKNEEIVYKGKLFPSTEEFREFIGSEKSKDGGEILKTIVDRPETYGIIDTGARFKEILTPALTYLKMAEGLELDINNRDDVKNFLQNILPTRMGEYLGKFHQLGFKHTYPGSKNWLLVSKLVDLDSVHGKLLGENLPTDAEIEQDLCESISAIQSIFLQAGKSIEVSFKDKEGKRQYNQIPYTGYIWSLWGDDPEKMKEVGDNAIKNMLKTYMTKYGVTKKYLVDHIDPDVFPVAELFNV